MIPHIVDLALYYISVYYGDLRRHSRHQLYMKARGIVAHDRILNGRRA